MTGPIPIGLLTLGLWAGASVSAGAQPVAKSKQPPALIVKSIQWGPAQRFEGDQRLLPGQVLEVCGPLNQGQAVDWSFYANAPLGFQVLHRLGKRVVSVRRTHLENKLQPRKDRVHEGIGGHDGKRQGSDEAAIQRGV